MIKRNCGAFVMDVDQLYQVCRELVTKKQ